MESLKIAFYTDTFLPAHDGVVSSILGSKRELEKRGHEVYIFASGNEQTKELANGEKNIYVVKGMKFRKYPQYSLALAPFMSIPEVRDINPDIVHTHTPFLMGSWAMVYAKMNRVPIVSTFHTLFTDKHVLREYVSEYFPVRLLERGAWRYARLYYNRCNEVIAPSVSIKAMLERNGINNVDVVPNGIDLKRFNKDANGSKIRKSLKRKRDEKIVLYIGRISKEKKIETLLKAARLLKKENIRFVLGGTGPSYDKYTKMAHRMGLSNVAFTGFVPEKDIAKYYVAADAFCTPSTFETQGIVAEEAMACGKPVIAADRLAFRDVIKKGKNGERFKANDSRDCARKIQKVLNNLDAYKETTKTAQEYSIVKSTDRLLSVYKRVLERINI